MEEKTNSQSTSNTALGSHLAGRSSANDDDIVGFAWEGGDWVGGWMEVDLWPGGGHAGWVSER